VTLKLGEGDSLPSLKGLAVEQRAIAVAPGTITFVALPAANNTACKL
jgi:hypothetical protein